jgi:polyprenyl-phospho-N-acetylgalactosaminyl synthase
LSRVDRTGAGHDDVWVVVPVHNEQGMIRSVVEGLRETFPHVVCVDDGSTDMSAAAVAATGAHLVRHCVNLGQGAAIQTGLAYALRQPGARWFVTFDADGQHRVEDAAAMVDVVRSGRCDAALGSRFLGAATDMPLRKRLALRAAVALSPTARRLRLTDTHNGLRVFGRPVAERLQITMNRMAHASEIVALLAAGGWRVEEVPVTVRYTDYSVAKGQSLLNGVNILFDLSMKHTGA